MIRAAQQEPLPTSDRELMAWIGNGKLEALGELFDRHEPDVRRLLGHLGVGAADIDDLVQETFLEVLRAAPRFDPGLPVKNWLCGIAVILVRRHRRSLSRLAAQLLARVRLPRPESPPTPAAEFERDEELLRLQRAIDGLSEKKREVFILVTLEGLSSEAVARALDIPVPTVRTRLHHARQELRAGLDEVGR